MESAFIWVPEMKLLVKTLAGRATSADIIASMDEEVEIGLGHTDLLKLIDIREVELEMTTREVRGLADWYRERGLTSSTASIAVVTSTPNPTAMAMVYVQALASLRPSRAFTTPRAAVEWLGLEPEGVAAHWPDATHPA